MTDDEQRITMSRPAAQRPDYGPASADRPDIKAATLIWQRHLGETPDSIARMIGVIERDELVLDCVEAWTDNGSGWHWMFVTDRRILRSPGEPEPAIYEIPIATVISVNQMDTKDDLVQVKIVDRDGFFKLWLLSSFWYQRFWLSVTRARSFQYTCPAPSPEPTRGAGIATQFEAFTALRAEIDAGTVPQDRIGQRIAAVFGVTEPGASGL